MNNREQYKRMLNFLANAVILFFQGMCFAYIWYEYYSRVIFMPFFRRGNWAVVGMYVLILFFFTRVMGGYKVGYLRISDICPCDHNDRPDRHIISADHTDLQISDHITC